MNDGGPESYYEAYNYWAEYNADSDPREYGIFPQSMIGPLRAKQQLESGKFNGPLRCLISLSLMKLLPICASSFQPLIRTASTAGALTILRRFFLMIVIGGFVPSLLVCQLTKNLQMQTPSQPHMRYICVV